MHCCVVQCVWMSCRTSALLSSRLLAGRHASVQLTTRLRRRDVECKLQRAITRQLGGSCGAAARTPPCCGAATLHEQSQSQTSVLSSRLLTGRHASVPLIIWTRQTSNLAIIRWQLGCSCGFFACTAPCCRIATCYVRSQSPTPVLSSRLCTGRHASAQQTTRTQLTSRTRVPASQRTAAGGLLWCLSVHSALLRGPRCAQGSPAFASQQLRLALLQYLLQSVCVNAQLKAPSCRLQLSLLGLVLQSRSRHGLHSSVCVLRTRSPALARS